MTQITWYEVIGLDSEERTRRIISRYMLTIYLSYSCYDLKLEFRLHLGKDLRKSKGCYSSGKA